MRNDRDASGNKLTKRQRQQLAEVAAAGGSAAPKPDPNAGGSDANSDAKDSAPEPAKTPPGNPPRIPTTTSVPNVPPAPRS